MLAALAGLGGAIGFGGIPVISAPTAPQVRISRRQLLRAQSSGGVIRWGYLKHPKQTVAQNKRAAVKAKNRAKHRAACRG